MILRRVISHFRNQEWTAIGIDFVIVVIGVFVGIQVSNWNEARNERRAERQLIERLDGEIARLLAVTREEMSGMRERVAPSATVNPVLFGQEPSRPFTVKECEWIAGSHIYRRATDELPVLDEMVATGRLDLIRDQEVKKHLREYIYLRERERGNFTERTNELFRLFHLFPAEVRVTRAPLTPDYDGRWTFLSGDGFRWVANCDVDRMRRNQSFLNDYVDNVGRNANMLMNFERREEQLTVLQSVVAAKLGKPVAATAVAE